MHGHITYSLENVPRQEVEDVIREVGLWELVEKLPQGLDTQLGEYGDKFSGGQRQQISIARALNRKPKIIVFDEVTSVLDPASEKKVQEATTNMVKNCTIFLVTHRISTIRNADCVVVMKGGHIVEVGIYGELMKKRVFLRIEILAIIKNYRA